MRFYFPDSQDLVSPTYDFHRDEYSPLRVRQRDDRYAHEVLDAAPYRGLLVSKSIVDGSVKGAGKYTAPSARACTAWASGASSGCPSDVETLGDNGAFNYADEPCRPSPSTRRSTSTKVAASTPASASTTSSSATSRAHDLRDGRPGLGRAATAHPAPRRGVHRTRSRIKRLARRPGRRGPRLEPRQLRRQRASNFRTWATSASRSAAWCRSRPRTSWSASTRSMASGTRTRNCISWASPAFDSMDEFAEHGVTSFDSTSAFRQAFMDDRKNFHTADDAFVALRVPQVDGNPTLKRAILAGRVSQKEAVEHERACLKALRAFDGSDAAIDEALTALGDVRGHLPEQEDLPARVRRTLAAAPWTTCPCSLCRELGIEIAIFRGTERNKRRGFHNLSVLVEQDEASEGPGTRGQRKEYPWLTGTTSGSRRSGSGKASQFIYCFGVDGKRIHDFATVSRVHRDDESLQGYQRPEVLSHIRAIRRYLESDGAMLPNAIVLAFDERVRFEPSATDASVDYSTVGELVIPVDESLPDDEKPAWLVDGQQRSAAIRDADLAEFPSLPSASSRTARPSSARSSSWSTTPSHCPRA